MRPGKITFLNILHASANETTGKLENHIIGVVIENGGNSIYHTPIRDLPTCAKCGVLISWGDVVAMVGDLVYHRGCCECACPTHRGRNRSESALPEKPRKPLRPGQLALF